MMHEINIFYRNTFGGRNSGRRKVDDTPHAGLYQIVGCALSSFRRCGYDSDFNVEFADFFFQPAGADHFKTSNFFTYLERVAVKSSHEYKTPAPKNSMAQERASKITDTNQSDIPRPVNTQRLLNGCQQILNIIPNTSHTEFPKISEILTNLRGIHSTSACQPI